MRIKAIFPSSRRTSSAEYQQSTIDMVKSYASPGTELDVVYPDAPAHIGPRVGHINEARIESSAQYVIREAIKAEKDGFDGIWLAGEYNVGAEVARHMVNIPIVDTGPAALHTAALIGDSICLITIEDSLRSYLRKLLKRWGMTDFVTSVKAWNIRVPEVWERRNEIKDLTIRLCKEAIEQNDAQVILPFCSVFVPLVVPAEEIEKAVGVPVINLYAVGLRMTEMFVSLKIHKSERAYPPTPTDIYQ